MAALIIGVTGPIGSGKSAVSVELRRLGARVIDVDRVGKSVTGSETTLSKLESRFGPSVRTTSGRLSRRGVAKIVFAREDRTALRDFNRIVQPLLTRTLLAIIARERKTSKKPVALDAALLIHWPQALRRMDEVLVVTAPAQIRFRRILARGGDAKDAKRRIRAQSSSATYRRYATYLISNTSTSAALRREVRRFWAERVVNR